MKSPASLFVGTCLWAFAVAPLSAQSSPKGSPAMEERPEENLALEEDGAIIVRGERLRGQLQVEQAPVLELNEADIEGIGANSINELLEVISPQTGSSRGRGGGRPAILVNGLRISSFRELRSYPPEAIRKVEVMPEEVAVRFGFPPDRRVINLILKENYNSREIELEYEGPSEGGFAAREAEFTYLKFDQGQRLNFNAEINDRTMLTEDERDIIQTEGSVSSIASDPDPAPFRSLLSDRRQIEATINWTKSNLDNGSLVTLNGTYEREESRGLSGLNSVVLTDAFDNEVLRTFAPETPLQRRTNSDTFSFGATHSRRFGGWQFTATTDATVAESTTLTDRRFDTTALRNAAFDGTLALDGDLPASADAGFDTSNNRTLRSSSQVTLIGNPLQLPAGEVSTTFDLGFDWLKIESDDTRTLLNTDLSRSRLNAGGNIAIPVAERGGAWGAIGDVTLNLNAGVEELSDFGTLTDASAGVTWGVAEGLDLSATYILTQVAPSLSQLGSPQIQFFNVPVFDFVAGETSLVTVTSGGNPDLRDEQQKDWKFGANWQLPFWDGTRFTVEYIRNKSEDVTSGFPVLTEAIEAAFPDRVTRDASGQLVELDQRFVTFAETRSERLVFGLTTRGSFGKRAASGGPPSGRPEGAARSGRPRDEARGADGPPSAEQRERFMAMRERICADDGLVVLTNLAGAIARGDDLSTEFPDFDAQRAARMVGRFLGEDGTVDEERLAQFRERMCSMDPSQMRGGGRPPGAGDGAPTAGRSGGGGPPPGIGSRGFGGDGRGRYFVNLTHNVELANTVLIAEGVPVLDQLDGDATGSTGFARHTSRLEAGIFRKGKGLRLSGRYTGKARINGTDSLFFGDLATFDIRMFLNLGEVFDAKDTFAKNLRLSLRADNVFNARRQVRNANGDVPLAFQPDLIDPTGRYIGIDLRKMF